MRGGGRATVMMLAAVTMMAACGSDSKAGNQPRATSGDGSATLPASAATTGSGGVNAKAPDPCTLLTDADINAGFALSDVKAPIDQVQRTPNTITPDTKSCDFAWHATNDNASSFALYVYPADVYQSLQTGGGAHETVPEIPGAFETADGYFIAAGGITLSLTGVVSVPASGKLLQLAAAKLSG